MGQVVPFIARLRDSGDWTAAERARLNELADRLAASGVHVEVIFGATDEGDPWCVVTDQNGDVLIHVARIDGTFVVHSAVDDAVNESVDLHAALRDRLAATEEAVAPQSATILPFSARQGQTFLALVAAAAFFYETAAIGDTAEAAEPAPALPAADPPPPPLETEATAQDRETVAQGIVLQPVSTGAVTLAAAGSVVAAAVPTEDARVAPAPAAELLAAAPVARTEIAASAPAPEPLQVIQGTAGDDLLVGTSADEHIVGGDGNDTLRGGGGHDLLDGGAGDDVIELTGEVTAIGGAGADTFVIQAPVQMGRADTLLGVILDFSRLDGDRIFTSGGEAVRLLPHRPPETDGEKSLPPSTTGTDGSLTTTSPPPDHTTNGGDFNSTSGPGGFGPSTVGPPSTLAPGGTTPLTRVDVDLDGDGVLDGYLLLAPPSGVSSTFDANGVTTAGRIGLSTRYEVDLDGDGASDGHILVGPRGVSEVTVTSVGVAFSYNDPFN